ncbi:MAG: RNA methyltransferase [Candidatus Micrarchaeota archaeon]|nr:RNA methyltransferase [Candidatus Micrarchaeota archaeon]
MEKFRIIFVEPEQEINLGLSARVMDNFNIRSMYLINPKCSLGFSAIMYAKHAKRIIKNAKIYSKLEDALKGCDLVVGTSGVINKYTDISFGPIELKQFKKILEERKTKKPIAILFGRESTGLNREEIKLCDVLVHIPTSKRYPVLNITNALAIVLYELSNIKFKSGAEQLATKKEREYIEKLVEKKLEKIKNLKNRQKLSYALRAFFEKRFMTNIEAKGLIYILKN